MTLVLLGFVELYEPWEIGDEVDKVWPVTSDLPDDLIERFKKARDEMDDVWNEMRRYRRAAA